MCIFASLSISIVINSIIAVNLSIMGILILNILFISIKLTVAIALELQVRFTDFAKLWWKLDKVNTITFCYYDLFMLGLIAEIWPKTSKLSKK